MSSRSKSLDKQSPSSKSDGVKAYKLKVASFVNAEKLTLLEGLAKEWSRVALEAFDWLWWDFLNPTIGLFDMYKARSGSTSSFPKKTLVTSQKDLLAVALQGQAKSWVGNLKNRGALILARHHAKLLDRLSSESQIETEDVQAALAKLNQFNHELNWINSMRLWNVPYEVQCHLLSESQKREKTELSSLSLKASLLMHRWFRQYVTHFKLPHPAYLPLQVNVNSSVFTKNDHSTLNEDGYWLRLSTLKGRIELPLMRHSYFDQDRQAPNLTFSLLKQDDRWFVVATKKQMKVPAPAQKKSKSTKEALIDRLLQSKEANW